VRTAGDPPRFSTIRCVCLTNQSDSRRLEVTPANYRAFAGHFSREMLYNKRKAKRLERPIAEASSGRCTPH